ncbi:MAG: hypothetical protein WCC00_00665 [Candidatus Aminicenantales bacterium]
MKPATRHIMLCVAASSVLMIAASLVPAGQTAAQATKVKTPDKALAQDVYRKLTTPTSRDVLLQSIKALPRPASPLPQAANPLPQAAKPISPQRKLEMRRGTDKNRAGTPARAAGAALSPSMSTGYEQIDWNAGVFISPFSVPRYGLGNWPAAEITTYYVEYVKSQDPGVVFLDWPPLQGSGYYMTYPMVRAAMELPETAALYTITLKVARTDGACLESWVRNRGNGGPPPIRVYFGNGGYPISMTKLVDDSGFVGIVNLQPGPAWDGAAYGIRAVNAFIQIDVCPWAANQEEQPPGLDTLVFGGITVTRLQ